MALYGAGVAYGTARAGDVSGGSNRDLIYAEFKGPGRRMIFRRTLF